MTPRNVPEFKECAMCKLTLPAANFALDPRMMSGLNSYCRDCRRIDARRRYAANPEHIRALARKAAARRRTPERSRAEHLKHKYGLTIAAYDAMLAAQEGRCAICRTDTPGGRGNWHVDHCHDMNRVRALLCAACNVGIAQLRHDPARLRAAATYIEFHRDKETDQ